MSNGKKEGEDGSLLGDLGDDLFGELEQWDEMFDSLHEGGPREPAASADTAAAAGESAAERSDKQTLEPPIVPNTPGEEDVDGPFPLRGGEVDLDGEPRALGALLGVAKPGRGDESEDDALYTSAVRAEGDETKPKRRLAATIRRAPRETRPAPLVGAGSADSGDERGDDEPSVAAQDLVERLAESAEELFREAPPEVSLELDDDFYDGIEVDAAEVGQDSRPQAAPTVPAAASLAGEPARRTTRNIVRRERPQRTTRPAPLAGVDEQEEGVESVPAAQADSQVSGEVEVEEPMFDLIEEVPLLEERAPIEVAEAIDHASLSPFDDDSGSQEREVAAGLDEPVAEDSIESIGEDSIDIAFEEITRPPEFAKSADGSGDADLTAAGEADGGELQVIEESEDDAEPPSLPIASRTMDLQIRVSKLDERPPSTDSEQRSGEPPPGQAPGAVKVPPLVPPPPPGSSARARAARNESPVPRPVTAQSSSATSSRTLDLQIQVSKAEAQGAAPVAPIIDDDDEVEAAFAEAVAMDDGTLTPPTVSEVDVAPDLPPAKFAQAEPRIDFAAISVTDTGPTTEDRTEEVTRMLLLVERELELIDEPGAAARLRLEAGRLAEQIGDLDRARAHYDSSIQLDPRLRPPLRALRRIERLLGNFGQAQRHLEAEIGLTSEMERRALSAHRADMLMAMQEQDVARVAVGDLLDDGPNDVRALLANLELAWIDGRKDELSATLEKLAQAVADRDLQCSLYRASASVRPDQALAALGKALAAAPDDRATLMDRALHALGSGDELAASHLGAWLHDGKLADVAPRLAGGLSWRQAELAGRSGDPEQLAAALDRAVDLLPDEPRLLEAHAGVLAGAGQFDRAAHSLQALADRAPGRAYRARAYRQAARFAQAAGDRTLAKEALEAALATDGGDALARVELEEHLVSTGDTDALLGLHRQAVDADEKAVSIRLLYARRLEQAGRADDATAVLQSARRLGVRSAAVDGELVDRLAEGGQAMQLAQLCDELLEEQSPYHDRAALLRRLAWARERCIAEQAAGGEAASLGDQWDDRSASGLFEGSLDAASDRLDPGDEGAIPEPIFGPPSAQHPESSGPRDGVWREPAPPSGPYPLSTDQRRNQAVAAWQVVLDVDPDATDARLAIRRLTSDRADDDSQAQDASGGSLPAWTVELVSERAHRLINRGDKDAAEEMLRQISAVDLADPRGHLLLVELLASSERWNDAAQVLVDRADLIGESDEALGLRYRAASILIDRTDELRRAADLLAPVATARPDFAMASEQVRAAQRRLGEAVPVTGSVTPAQVARASAGDDGYVRLIREAEAVEIEIGDASRAAELFEQAMKIRPGDPLAREGFARTAARAGETAPLAELALADLRRAEAMADPASQAAAYEELARIDEELRGDHPSAVLGWEAALDADPTRLQVIRRLERAYLAAGSEREADLLRVYARAAEILAGPREKLAALAESARLSERLDRGEVELLDWYRRILELDPGYRMALFHLESAARRAGASLERADLERAVARYFSRDARAEAAFYTRAGETLRQLGDREGAISSFRAAVTALPGYGPALAGWREAATQGEMWIEVADVAEREADNTESQDERARLYHLAGVTLMDRASDGERAVGALRRVLDINPAHRDAFLRLKLLYEEMGRDLEIVELYQKRLEVETTPAMKARLHLGLAGLYRNFFDDREASRRHLRAALELEPTNALAIAELSDISWELGEWAEAADMLIKRAKQETRPEVLRNIFYRLGVIYADHLPDARYAMMSFQRVLSFDATDRDAMARVARLAMASGDHRLALGACEQLIKLTDRDADKVPYLHMAAQVYLEGFDDRAKAERALRIALDLDPTSDEALDALVGFYRDAGDMRSVRVHLDRVAGAMRRVTASEPAVPGPYHVIARALEAREQAGVRGSLAVAGCAAELAVVFGSEDEIDVQMARVAARARPPLSALGQPDIDELLYPPEASSSLRAMFRLLGERLAKHVGIDLRQYGVGRGERLRKGSDPLAGMILEMAAEMGIDDVDIYLSAKQPTVLAVEPTNPVSLVVGAELATLDRPAELRFLVGRQLKLALSSLAVPARMAPEQLGIMLAGILRQFAPDFAPAGLSAEEIQASQQKLRRLIPSQMVQELAPFALGVAGANFDYRALSAGISDGGNRAGLLAAGSAQAALSSMLRMGGYRDIHQGLQDPAIVRLINFTVSDDHVRLREQSGG